MKDINSIAAFCVLTEAILTMAELPGSLNLLGLAVTIVIHRVLLWVGLAHCLNKSKMASCTSAAQLREQVRAATSLKPQ